LTAHETGYEHHDAAGGYSSFVPSNLLPPRSKNAWNYTFTPQYAFMARWSVKKEQMDNFLCTFIFTSAEVKKNVWNYNSTPPYVSMALCLIKHRLRLHGVVLSSAHGASTVNKCFENDMKFKCSLSNGARRMQKELYQNHSSYSLIGVTEPRNNNI